MAAAIVTQSLIEKALMELLYEYGSVSTSDAYERLADKFQLTEEELSRQYSSFPVGVRVGELNVDAEFAAHVNKIENTRKKHAPISYFEALRIDVGETLTFKDNDGIEIPDITAVVADVKKRRIIFHGENMGLSASAKIIFKEEKERIWEEVRGGTRWSYKGETLTNLYNGILELNNRSESQWEYDIRSARLKLVSQEIIAPVEQSGRGIWQLAEGTGRPDQREGKETHTRSGPPPHLKGKWVYHDNQKKDGWVYILQWGETDIYKYGYTNSLPRRVSEIGHHIPNQKNEFPDQATWVLIQSSETFPIEEAFELEQSIKREVEHLGYNTAFERFRCTPRQLKNLVKSFL